MGYASGPRVGVEYHTGFIGTGSVFGGSLLRTDGTVGFSSGGSCLLGNTGTLSWTTRCAMKCPVDGVITLLNAAQTDFTRLQFGGTAGTFPAISKSTTGIAFKLADDSAFTFALALNFIANGAAASGGAGTVSIGGTTATTVGAAGAASALPATPVGYIIINVAGTQMKIPYYNT